MNKLLENQRVQLTTVAVIVSAVVGLVYADATWKTSVSRDLSEIREKQERLGWHREDMARWVRATEKLNWQAGWSGADVDQEFGNP